MRRAGLADLDQINDLLNDPAIRPSIGGDGVLNAESLIADARNVCLFDERGGALFRWTGPGVFEGHSFFRVRGREALRAGRDALRMVGADLVWGLTPIELRAARWFNRQLGFTSLGEIDTPDLGRCELFEMRF